jgi:hypothetical protein
VQSLVPKDVVHNLSWYLGYVQRRMRLGCQNCALAHMLIEKAGAPENNPGFYGQLTFAATSQAELVT